MTTVTPGTGTGSDYPVDVRLEYPEHSSRGLALLGILFFLKAVLLVPHIIVLYFLTLASFIVVFVSYFAVLFTGRYPKGLFDFVGGVLRWQTRINAWFYGLTDKYPPFSLA
ncbi:MAG: DUF4389 domain-containing protein [Bacillota bacterium]